MSGAANDFPKADDEKSKCLDFLRNFRATGDYRKYMDQMQEISNRQRKVLEILVDDIFDFKNDLDFVENVKNNTCRYLRYFEAAADELLPAASVNNREQDVFDILQVHSGRLFALTDWKRLFDRFHPELTRHTTSEQIAQNQHEVNQIRINPNNLTPKVDMPAGLLRRYEVSIIPSFTEKARKIREIKAAGKEPLSGRIEVHLLIRD